MPQLQPAADCLQYQAEAVCAKTDYLESCAICGYHIATYSTTYSKLDAKYRFWSIHVTHENSLLTTFNMQLGKYDFKCLPFSLKDVF